METEIVKLSQIKVNNANPRTISNEKFDKLIDSILVLPKMLELRPIVVDNTFVALGGNMRYRALTAIESMSIDELAQRLSGLRDYNKKTEAERQNLIAFWNEWKANPDAPIIKASELSEDERREFIIKDNIGYGVWDMDALANEWDNQDLDDWGLDVWQDNGGSEGGSGTENSSPSNVSLNDRFVVPPFSILDTRKGYWKARKKMWRELIGDMGESRENTLAAGEIDYVASINKGVSLFDPVLSEICCRWFTPKDGAKIFDCFAGDTQKGLVFGQCGYNFTGIELRQEQIDVNNKVLMGRNLPVKYICDDGQNVANHFEAGSQDLLFSCPPYFDLEKYSELENDASNQESYDDFIQILRNAFTAAIDCLKENRFAVIVVGDVRDKSTGFYYDFCGDIKNIFKEGGMRLYNECILIEPIGTLPQRVQHYMYNRKVGKCHQNILVFYKGNPKDIKKHFPKIEFTQDELALFEKEQGCEEETSNMEG